MTSRYDDLRFRPGRIQQGNKGAKPAKSFVAEAMRAAKKAANVGDSFRSSQGRSRSQLGRQAGGHGGARGAPPERTLLLGATNQAYRLPET
jgi:hypothetical protein